MVGGSWNSEEWLGTAIQVSGASDQGTDWASWKRGRSEPNAFQFHWRTFSENLRTRSWVTCDIPSTMLGPGTQHWMRKTGAQPALMNLPVSQDKPVQRVIIMCDKGQRFPWESVAEESVGSNGRRQKSLSLRDMIIWKQWSQMRLQGRECREWRGRARVSLTRVGKGEARGEAVGEEEGGSEESGESQVRSWLCSRAECFEIQSGLREKWVSVCWLG